LQSPTEDPAKGWGDDEASIPDIFITQGQGYIAGVSAVLIPLSCRCCSVGGMGGMLCNLNGQFWCDGREVPAGPDRVVDLSGSSDTLWLNAMHNPSRRAQVHHLGIFFQPGLQVRQFHGSVQATIGYGLNRHGIADLPNMRLNPSKVLSRDVIEASGPGVPETIAVDEPPIVSKHQFQVLESRRGFSESLARERIQNHAHIRCVAYGDDAFQHLRRHQAARVSADPLAVGHFDKPRIALRVKDDPIWIEAIEVA